ncbi:hypothetical protein IKQ19_14935 [Candidatus Saccharibacteria bacterium]|nr:hypothetical protein [Candidatus Saccharibacteria bacterium]
MLELKKCHLKCDKCGAEFDAPANLEADSYSEERNMGMQIGYTWTHEDECPHCHEPYSFEINAWEYPIGILDSEDSKSEGVELDYEVDVVYEWEYVEPSTFGEFNTTIQELRKMLKFSFTSANDTFFKMVDAFAVTAMEAYLSGTLIKKVKENDDYLLNAAQKIENLKDEKMTLYEVVKNPDQAKNRILEKLYEFMYHNLPKIKCIYEAVFGIKIDYPLKDLMSIVRRRHDIVHRNGKNKDGVEIVLTAAMVEQDIDVISSFVKKINDLIDPDLDITIPV